MSMARKSVAERETPLSLEDGAVNCPMANYGAICPTEQESHGGSHIRGKPPCCGNNHYRNDAIDAPHPRQANEEAA